MSFSGPVQVFNLNPHSSDTVQQHDLGTLGITRKGDKYRYAEAGAAALNPGQLCIATDVTANHEDLAVNTFAIGDTSITVTLGGTAVVANEYAGGKMFVIDELGQGIAYLIDQHEASAAGGEDIIVILKEPIQVAAAAATTVTLVRNKFKNILVSDGTQADLPVGVPNVDIAASSFGWVQTGGLCSILVDANDSTAGTPVTIGDGTAGAVETKNGASESLVGIQFAGTGADVGEYGAFDLALE